MGASNFYYKNANRLYPVFTDMDDAEREWFDYSEECLNLAEYIDDEIVFDSIENEPRGYERNYPERLLGYKDVSKTFGDVTVEVRLSVIIRAGYYDGACLDYEFYYFADSIDSESIDDVASDWYEYTDTRMNAGMCAIQQRNAEKWLSKAEAMLTDQIESAFAKVTTPYDRIGTASNGETFYKKSEV